MTYDTGKLAKLREQKEQKQAAIRELLDRRDCARANWREAERHIADLKNHYDNSRGPHSRWKSAAEAELKKHQPEIDKARGEYESLVSEYQIQSNEMQELSQLLSRCEDFVGKEGSFLAPPFLLNGNAIS